MTTGHPCAKLPVRMKSFVGWSARGAAAALVAALLACGPAAAADAQGSPTNALPGAPLTVSFEVLGGWTFHETEEVMDGKKDPATAEKKTSEQIPPGVKALNDKSVALKGFMVPTKVELGRVTEFLLMESQAACCYGVPPRMNQWAMVKVAGKGFKPLMDQPIIVQGVLHVGAMRDDGYLTGLYRLDADSLVVPGAK